MNNTLSILDIVHCTTVDGPGFRTAIYGAGCTHQCPGCHNPQSWNIGAGTGYSIDAILEVIKDDDFSNVTFSGGDPLMQVDGFTELARQIKTTTDKTIWCYTGFLYDNILKNNELKKILPFIDVLVDGRYIAALRDPDLLFRGSSNQRIIDVPQSLSQQTTVMWTRQTERQLAI